MNRLKDVVATKWRQTFGKNEDDLKQALYALNIKAPTEAFDLRDVQLAFGSHKLPREDADNLLLFDGVIAHIEEASESIAEENTIPLLALQQIQKELKFIVGIPAPFWQQYGIEKVQQRVSIMFDKLTQQIDEIIQQKNQELKIRTEQHDMARHAQEQALYEAEAAKEQAEANRIEEQRLKLEAERELAQTKKDAAQKELERMQAVERFRAAEEEKKKQAEEQAQKQEMSQTTAAFEEQLASWSSKS